MFLWWIVFDISVVWLILCLVGCLAIAISCGLCFKKKKIGEGPILKMTRFSRGKLLNVYFEASAETLKQSLKRASSTYKKRMILERVSSKIILLRRR